MFIIGLDGSSLVHVAQGEHDQGISRGGKVAGLT